MFAQRLRIFGDLNREFTSWRQRKNARLTLRIRISFGRQYTLKGGDKKRRGLSGTGLRLTRHIAGSEGNRQGAGLDRCTELKACIADAGLNTLVQRQGVESEVAQMVFGHKIRTRKCA